jgi:hypothetical protein
MPPTRLGYSLTKKLQDVGFFWRVAILRMRNSSHAANRSRELSHEISLPAWVSPPFFLASVTT